jgi:hypothetical protein
MTFEELLTLKALKRKDLALGGTENVDALIDQLLMKNEGDHYRNVCAHISIQLADELDALCISLDMTKRRFVEGALIDAVKLANAILTQFQLSDPEA